MIWSRRLPPRQRHLQTGDRLLRLQRKSLAYIRTALSMSTAAVEHVFYVKHSSQDREPLIPLKQRDATPPGFETVASREYVRYDHVTAAQDGVRTSLREVWSHAVIMQVCIASNQIACSGFHI